jgi:hypothetical protein
MVFIQHVRTPLGNTHGGLNAGNRESGGVGDFECQQRLIVDALDCVFADASPPIVISARVLVV